MQKANQQRHPLDLQDSANLLSFQITCCFCEKELLCLFPQFYAVYAFQARCDQELTLQEYQHVRILQFCDLGGNKEWWLAEANGQKGYVPANYLGRMSYA